MNIKNVLSLILVKYSNDDGINEKVLEEIQEAIKEMQAAEAIEAEIYREETAKKKFDYLLSIDKEQYSRQKIEPNEEMEI